MKAVIAAAAGLCLTACQPDSDKTNPAIATESSTADRVQTAPAAGASSFTETQARERIVGAGYTDVTALMQDAEGAWSATASKGGVSTSVKVDYQGNVTAQ